MKVLVLSGNTRMHGNTMMLTKRFMDGVIACGGEVELIDSTKLNVKPCTGCLYCEAKGECIIKDDMNEVYKKIIESDIIVLSSPVYFASVSAQLKAVIDRCQMLFSRNFKLKSAIVKKRLGYIIFTAGGQNKNMILSMELLAKFFFLSCSGVLKKSIFALETDSTPVEYRAELLEETYKAGCEAVKD